MEDAPLPADRSDRPDRTDPLRQRVVTGLAKLGLASRHQAWAGATELGLTPTQGQILALLRARPGLRVADLAADLAITPATTTVAVRTLVAKGLVRKERTAGDGRARALTLTEAGRSAAGAASAWSDFLLGAVDELDPAEQTVFLRGLVKMIRALQERGDIPVARMCPTCVFFRPYQHDDPDRPHHCAFVDAPFGDRELRLDCRDHQPATATQATSTWERFSRDGQAG